MRTYDWVEQWISASQVYRVVTSTRFGGPTTDSTKHIALLYLKQIQAVLSKLEPEDEIHELYHETHRKHTIRSFPIKHNNSAGMVFTEPIHTSLHRTRTRNLPPIAPAAAAVAVCTSRTN